MGFVYFIFLYGVKIDLGLLKKTRKVHISTAIVGIVIPTATVLAVALAMRKNMDENLAKFSSLGSIASYLGTSSFLTIYHILEEFNLLNSDAGRISLSIAIIGDLFGLFIFLAFDAAHMGQFGIMSAVGFMFSLALIITFLLFCVRPAMIRINKNTAEGHPVNEYFVVVMLLGAFVMGLVTDAVGMAVATGPFFLGLAIPDGPYVGATLEKKTSAILGDFFLPFSFIMVGSYTDFYSITASGWSALSPLITMIIVGYLLKFFTTWISLHLFRMPLRDGLTVSLIMNLRGLTELILFVYYMEQSFVEVPGFSLLIFMTLSLTAISCPLISILYDPTKPYMVNQRRNIQHHPPDKEFRIVLCIFEQDDIHGLTHLLDISNPTENIPFSVSVVRLSELVGRVNPLFIDHEKQQVPPNYQWSSTIHVLERHQELKEPYMKFHFFTAVTPKKTMFRDVCELALEQEASLIILPFNRNVHNHMDSQVLNNAPCSVAIFVDKGLLKTSNTLGSFQRSKYRFAVLFLGGGDSREALVYADKMLARPQVSLTVIRFLTHNFVGYNEIEKKLDDGIVTWFWVKNEANQRVVYREVVVRNGEETIAAIQAMNDGAFDLLIVGRKHGINPILLTGLSDWIETEELGLIGDYISSADFFGSASELCLERELSIERELNPEGQLDVEGELGFEKELCLEGELDLWGQLDLEGKLGEEEKLGAEGELGSKGEFSLKK
ncbi:cation/H(+) antiporter 24 [Vigna angularis]|uniref:cation/H(+) antiporter 24 n=1 Tax=Phaseolus angularis TaxID=3914 RepID=UPI0022B3177A|nr:cation/H(+) antiporter 24 [Vigna angularis]